MIPSPVCIDPGFRARVAGHISFFEGLDRLISFDLAMLSSATLQSIPIRDPFGRVFSLPIQCFYFNRFGGVGATFLDGKLNSHCDRG